MSAEELRSFDGRVQLELCDGLVQQVMQLLKDTKSIEELLSNLSNLELDLYYLLYLFMSLT